MALEAEVKNCVTDHQTQQISYKMPIPGARRYIVTQSIVDFAGTGSWCCTLTNT